MPSLDNIFDSASAAPASAPASSAEPSLTNIFGTPATPPAKTATTTPAPAPAPVVSTAPTKPETLVAQTPASSFNPKDLFSKTNSFTMSQSTPAVADSVKNKPNDYTGTTFDGGETIGKAQPTKSESWIGKVVDAVSGFLGESNDQRYANQAVQKTIVDQNLVTIGKQIGVDKNFPLPLDTSGGNEALHQYNQNKMIADYVRTHWDDIKATNPNLPDHPEMLGPKYADVQKNIDSYAKELGVRTTPTNMEFIGYMMLAPVTGALGVPLAVGFGGMMAFSYVEHKVLGDSVANKIADKLGIQNTDIRNVLNLTEMFAVGGIFHNLYTKAPSAVQAFTKSIVETYMPGQKVYFEPTQVHDILSGRNTVTTPEQRAVFNSLGFNAEEMKTAVKNGVSIDVPAEKILTLIDKPYWAKIKSAFRINESTPVQLSRTPVGKSAVGTESRSSRLLGAGDVKTNEGAKILQQEIKQAVDTHGELLTNQALQENLGIDATAASELILEAERAKTEDEINAASDEMLKTLGVNPTPEFNRVVPTPLEGMNPAQPTKLTNEQAAPLAQKAADEYWNAKIAKPLSEGKAIVLGADDLKDYFGNDYNDNNHPVYSRATYLQYERALKETNGDTVVLTGGGPGSGKTELLVKSLLNADFNGVIYDSNMSSKEGVSKQIDAARAAGKKVVVYGILPNLENARRFAILRENETGRGIQDAGFARGHAGFPNVTLALLEEGKLSENEVKILDTRNSKTKLEALMAVANGDFLKEPLAILRTLGYTEDNIKQNYAKTKFDAKTGQRIQEQRVRQEPDTSPNKDRPNLEGRDDGQGAGEMGGQGVDEAGKTQKQKVIDAVTEKPLSIKEVAKLTKILEPNVRRILGVGAKDGTFARVSEGVYVLKAKNGTFAYVEMGDAVTSLARMAEEGQKFDSVILDPAYYSRALIGGNRGIKQWNFIMPAEFAKVMSSVSKIVKADDSHVYLMLSGARTAQIDMDKYVAGATDAGLKVVGEGKFTKLFQSGKPVTNVRGEQAAAERMILLTKSGNARIGATENKLDFQFIRPAIAKSYQTEKPAELMKALIDQSTIEGETVLDPFAGSGVTGAEAIKAGRNAVLIERQASTVENFTKPRIEKTAQEIAEKMAKDFEPYNKIVDTLVIDHSIPQKIANQIAKEAITAKPVETTINLNAGINPNVDVFLKEDVVPTAGKALEGFKNTLAGIAHVLAPTVGVKAKDLDQIMRMKGARDKQEYIFNKTNEIIKKAFDKMSQDEQVAFIDTMKRGGQQANEGLQAIADMLREIDTAMWNRAKQFKPSLAWKENHFRVLWKTIPGAPETKGFKGLFTRPLQGTKGFTKQSTLYDMSEGLAKGGIPISYNPMTLFSYAYADMNKFITAQEMIQSFKDGGQMKYVPVGGTTPDGYTRINDTISKVFMPPEIKVSEFFDKRVMEQLNAVAKSLGVQHDRTIGGFRAGKMGESLTGQNKIRTRVASPEAVVSHEIGHQIDEKYGLQDIFMKSKNDVKSPRENLEYRKTQIEFAQDALDSNPAKGLSKYANKFGELPEVIGEKGKTEFAKRGDDIITELGFTNSEQAREEYQKYASQRARLAEMKKNYSELLAGARAADKANIGEVSAMQKEFRALVDLKLGDEKNTGDTNFQKYIRKSEEKIATMFEALIHAPKEFQRVAPTLYANFTDFLGRHSELKPLLNIEPSMQFVQKDSTIDRGGLTQAGEWYVEENVARILNNFLSKDQIRSTDIGRGLLAVKNAFTAVELSMSPFHAVFESLEAMGSSIGLGIQKIARGDMSGLKDIAAAPITPYSTSHVGTQAIKYLTKQGFLDSPAGKSFIAKFPQAEALLNDLFIGGGKMKMDEGYRISTEETFLNNLKTGNYIGATLRALPALSKTITMPLFDVYIPRLKIGSFLKEYSNDLVDRAVDLANGTVTREQLARERWNFIEDRFGEMNFDNLFWNKTMKTSMQLLFRSVTWKLGNLRATGGAFWAQGKEFYDAVRQKRAPRVNPKMAWLLGMSVLTVVVGTLLQKTMTGNGPESVKDIIYPQIDDKGNRVSTPTYWKDAFHLVHDPAGYIQSSMSGNISRMIEVWNNSDFYGTEIWSPTDPFYKKMTEAMIHLIPSPFSVSSAISLNQTGAPLSKSALSFFGFTKAPGYINNTPLQEQIYSLLDKRNGGTKTTEDAATAKAKSDIKKAYQNGDSQKANELLKQAVAAGQIKQSSVAQFIKDADLPSDVKAFRMLPDADQRALLAKMTPEELNHFAWYASNDVKNNFSSISNNTADFTKAVKDGTLKQPVFKQGTEVSNNAKTPTFENGSTSSSQSVIDRVWNYAKAIGTDPVTAFNRIFTGQTIREVRNGTIIVDRMSLADSSSIKKALGGSTGMTLDHIVPLEGGGDNSKGNLQLISAEADKQNQAVEDFIGKEMKAGRMTGSEAREISIRFKAGLGQQLTPDLTKEYQDKYNSQPMTLGQVMDYNK